MKRTARWALLGAALGALPLAGPSSYAEGRNEDDLQVVKRAVQDRPPAPAAREEARAAPAPAPRAAGAPVQWLRVHVEKPGGKRVRIRLPLSLVRAVGDWPIDIGCNRRWRDDERRCSTRLRLSEVLDTLDRGESLVEVDDEGGTRVRVWIE